MTNLDEINSVEIYCNQCKKWFPAPISFGDFNSFDASILIGNTVECEYHGGMINCNKENMRIRGENGGFKGIDTE